MSVSGQLYRLTSTTTDGDNLRRVGYNIYVDEDFGDDAVAGGNCSAANPCPIWSDTYLLDSIMQPCTITLLGGSGTVYVSRLGSGGLGVTYTNGLTIASDTCPISKGDGFPGGSIPLWTWGASSGDVGGKRFGQSRRFVRLSWRDQSEDSTNLGVLRDAAFDRCEQCSHGRRSERHGLRIPTSIAWRGNPASAGRPRSRATSM